MDRQKILGEINEIFIDVLDIEDLVISEASSADDLDEWDSLNHIQLIVAIEKHLSIRFTSKEIQSWKDVGEMLDCIEGK